METDLARAREIVAVDKNRTESGGSYADAECRRLSKLYGPDIARALIAADERVTALEAALRRIESIPEPPASGWLLATDAPKIARAALAGSAPPDEKPPVRVPAHAIRVRVDAALRMPKPPQEAKGVLDTYGCIVSHLKNMPGARLEDIFPSSSVAELEQEYEFLKKLLTTEVRASQVDDLDAALAAARAEGRAEAADMIPTTWIDPLLSGPGAVLSSKGDGHWGCPDIERLLRALKDRILPPAPVAPNEETR